MRRLRRPSDGFSLIELLLVISIMAIVAGLVLPSASPATHDQLLSAARIIASDMAYARSLAVTDASSYRVTFDTEKNRYTLSSSEGRALPAATFSSAEDTQTQHVIDLDDLPSLGRAVRLLAVTEGVGSTNRASDVEFGPLGGTTRTAPTEIWLTAGSNENQRYINLTVNPITGLTTIGHYTAVAPPVAAVVAGRQKAGGPRRARPALRTTNERKACRFLAWLDG